MHRQMRRKLGFTSPDAGQVAIRHPQRTLLQPQYPEREAEASIGVAYYRAAETTQKISAISFFSSQVAPFPVHLRKAAISEARYRIGQRDQRLVMTLKASEARQRFAAPAVLRPTTTFAQCLPAFLWVSPVALFPVGNCLGGEQGQNSISQSAYQCVLASQRIYKGKLTEGVFVC